MKITDYDIVIASLRLFAEKGFNAVSTSMIASSLGITKGALYRHFESKQAIFDRIIEKMFELDEKQALDNDVPVKEFVDDEEAYKSTLLVDLCQFVTEQLVFWTHNEFACLFRRMIIIEQFTCEKMNKLYQDVIAAGPVKYTENLLREMIKNGQMISLAENVGAHNLALLLFAPLQLSIQLYDGGEDFEVIKDNLQTITNDFILRWMKGTV